MTMTFETFLSPARPRSDHRRRLTYFLSLALHGALLIAGVMMSFWHVDVLTPPTVPITFATFSPPPPPPPPPPRGSSKPTTPRTRTRTTALVQPRPDETPAPSQPGTASPESGKGDITGSTDSPCTDLLGCIGPADAPARMLPPQVARGQLAIDPQDERYRVRLPAAMATAGMTVWALVKVCAKPDGSVSEVKILKSADPAVDATIVAVLSTWRYQPYTLDGRPVPFCTTVRYEITAR